MISAAQVIYDNTIHNLSIAQILEHLRATIPYPCSVTEWQGYSTVIPQIRVETNVPMTIQIEDDPDYVPEEIEEMAETAVDYFDSATVALIRECRCRLEVMSVTPARIEGDERSISVYAETDLDPETPDVRQVLSALAKITGGYIYDCVNGRWMALSVR